MATPSTTQDYAAENKFRHVLTLNGKSYGNFDGDSVDFGGEIQVDFDPEDGEILVGGKQTGDDLKLSRTWKRVRDAPVYKELKPLRLIAVGFVAIFELDEYNQPLSTTPLDNMPCMLTNVVKPASSAKGSDTGRLEITVKVKG